MLEQLSAELVSGRDIIVILNIQFETLFFFFVRKWSITCGHETQQTIYKFFWLYNLKKVQIKALPYKSKHVC